ncbi:MAG TPA: M28 family peptidase [Bryobacteraceae bacterium]|nr:M28 family peptidase [Bryobacteraceae bacterium]
MRLTVSLLAFSLVPCAHAQLKSVNPTVQKIVDSVSQDRVTEILKKLESFGTRGIFSEQDNPAHGIGAARHWIYDQFKSYSPRLQVSFDNYRVKKGKGRIIQDVDLYNVVAVLPGKLNPERQFILSGHYDSLAMLRRAPDGSTAVPTDGQSGGPPPFDLSMLAPIEPGVTDDGSGTAAVMELARIMSQYEFEKTIVFVAFAGEEMGLVGSSLYARKARKENQIIDGVLNNDIIGSEVSGDGRIDNSTISVYSEDPDDSTSRQLARYVKDIGERYLPSVKIDLVFRADRIGRGGDHTPFNLEGYPAVRVTTPNENYANQHSVTDTFENTSVSYASRVIQANAAALASLALAPKAPVTNEPIKSGPRKGQPTPMISRGKTRYDSALRWKNENPEPDLLGYVIVMRKSTAPYWEKEVFVGNVTEYTFKDVSIDDVIFGVKAVDKDGNESLVAPYVPGPRQKLEIETY